MAGRTTIGQVLAGQVGLLSLGGLHVEVHESARHSRVRIPPAALSGEAGRGMRIVQVLCDGWGGRALTGEGRAVWTCFRRPEVRPCRASHSSRTP